jgi:pentatricopeptide repeat protein
MNLLSVFSLVILFLKATHAFTPTFWRGKFGTKFVQKDARIRFVSAATIVDTQEDTTEVSLSPSEVDEEKSLVLGFIDMVQNTPTGELSVDEADLLREISVNFPGDLDELEASQAVKTLLYRQIDEWSAASEAGDSQKEEAFRPTTQDFFNSISILEESENPDKAIHMLSILSDQREIFMSGISDVRPDLNTINCVLRVLSGSRERGVDRRASQVFQSLSDFDMQPDEETYSLVIPSLARSRDRGAADRAEKLLREAVEIFPPRMLDGVPAGINSDVFNVVVTAYAKSKGDDGPDKAQNLIVFMDTVDAENGSLGVCSPSIRTFTSLIDAYAQQNDWFAVCEADKVLNRLLEQFMEGNEDLEPSIATWTIVMSAWARLSKNNRKGAAERAARLLKRMEDLYGAGRISFKPDAYAYITGMNACALSKQGEGASEAERILREMNEIYLDGDDSMKPSARSIKICVESWIKAKNMDRVEGLVDDFEDYLLDDGSPEAAEGLMDVYRSILFGYSQMDNPSRAFFYLNLMVEEGLQPDSMCYER